MPAHFGRPAGWAPTDPVGGLVRPPGIFPVREPVKGLASGRTRYQSAVLATYGLTNYWPLNESIRPYVDRVAAYNLDTLDPTRVQSLVPSEPIESAASFPVIGSLWKTSTNYTCPPQVTLECWTKTNSAGSNSGIAGCWNTNGFMFFYGTVVGPEIRFYTGNGSLIGPTPVIGTTYHLVGTFDGTNRCFYVNGALFAGPTAGLAISSPALPFQVAGYAGNANYYDGTVDDIAIYNRALTHAEVWAHWQAGQL